MGEIRGRELEFGIQEAGATILRQVAYAPKLQWRHAQDEWIVPRLLEKSPKGWGAQG